jgi:L-asparaginase
VVDTAVREVTVLAAGGTIGMSPGGSGGAVPRLDADALVQAVPVLESVPGLRARTINTRPSVQLTAAEALDIARAAAAEADGGRGVVVTHGTDTLEETAYFLDLVHESEKPVAFVGAMRNASELGWDGPPNLIAAVRAVTDPALRGLGVVVVMNDEIAAAAEVTKTHTEAVDTFRSPDYGPIGIVDKDRVIVTRRPERRTHIPAVGQVPDVALVKMAAGMDGRLIRAAVSTGAAGLVIEALGRGNVPPETVPAIREAVAAGLPVVVTSRCLRGRVLDTYGYPGGGHELKEIGCIFAGSLPGQKARIRLMLAMAASRSAAEVAGYFEGL